MAIKTKEIKIGDHTVSILQFNALEALKLRKELVGAIKKQVGDISLGGDNVASIVKGVAGLVYEVPAEMYMDLFKNCSALGTGGLGNQENFNSVFEGNLDGATELAMEVLDFNGFFSLSIISVIAKKVPMLKPMEDAIKQALNDAKSV